MVAIEQKVSRLLSRLSELEALLGQGEIFNDPKKYRTLAQEHSSLVELQQVWSQLNAARQQLKDNESCLKNEIDPEFIAVLKEDSEVLEGKINSLEQVLRDLLIPPHPDDSRNTILELRAGTGGDEAALFVGDCVRMYKLFADRKGWRYEHLSSTPAEIGGFKEYVMVLSGPNVHRFLQYEGGAHRVQRVPETEAQGRIHTSAITVAVLLEPEEGSEVQIEEKDLRVDTYRSSGAGGQHVNTTDSAVRLTHIPTGIVVYCQEERSQHKNKERAMRLLSAKIDEVERLKKEKDRASDRAEQVGTGDRSEKIRTYNFPQNRVTDHRINYTEYNLERVMHQGALDKITGALVAFYQHQE